MLLSYWITSKKPKLMHKKDFNNLYLLEFNLLRNIEQ